MALSAAVNLLTGSYNIAIGANSSGGASGVQWTSTESGNIAIGSAGVTGESNVTRIGTQALQTAAYMAGVSGVSVANLNIVTINTVTGQLGSQAAPSTGIVTIDGDSGSITGATVKIYANNVGNGSGS